MILFGVVGLVVFVCYTCCLWVCLGLRCWYLLCVLLVALGCCFNSDLFYLFAQLRLV